MCLFHSGALLFVTERKNQVSIIFVATKKNYIHKILVVDTASDQAAEVIKVIFLY
jgi:hypothetical protein